MDEREFELQLKGDFLNEADEIIQNLELKLLSLEDNERQIEALNELFRNAHTLKGSGMVAGFSFFANFAHKMESLLDILRSSDIEVEKEDVDILLLSLDKLKEISRELKTNFDAVVPVEEVESLLLNRIKILLDIKEKGSADAVSTNAKLEQDRNSDSGYTQNPQQTSLKSETSKIHESETLPMGDQNLLVYICGEDANLSSLIKLSLGSPKWAAIHSDYSKFLEVVKKDKPSLAILDEIFARETFLKDDKDSSFFEDMRGVRFIIYGSAELNNKLKNLNNILEYRCLTRPLRKKAIINTLESLLGFKTSINIRTKLSA